MAVDSLTNPATTRRRLRLRHAVSALLLLALLLTGGWYANAHYRVPRQHLNAANLALAEREFGQARSHLEECLKIWPDDPSMHFLMARTARRASDLALAEKHLTRCEHLQNDRPDPSLGDTQLEWALIQAQHGKLSEVEALLRRRLREDHPDSLLILEAMSWELMGRNRLSEALILLNIWLEKEPKNYEALVRRGWVFEHLLVREEAIKDYLAALEIRPERDNVRERLVELLSAGNRNVEAFEQATELLRRRPDDEGVQICYARCLRAQGETEKSVSVLDELLAKHPHNVPAMALRAQIAYDSGEFEKARLLLTRASNADPANRLLLYTLFLCLKKMDHPQEVKGVEQRLAKMDADIKQMDKLVRGTSARPNDPTARYEAGAIFLRYGMTQDGLHWLSTALELDPNHRPTHQALAEYYERSGDKELAAWHRRFLE
jgi:tetratricopeptide (TPR) repeat protein